MSSPDNKNDLQFKGVSLPAHARLPLLICRDLVAWLKGEDDYHAPSIVGWEKLPEALMLGLWSLAEDRPGMRDRIASYVPSFTLQLEYLNTALWFLKANGKDWKKMSAKQIYEYEQNNRRILGKAAAVFPGAKVSR